LFTEEFYRFLPRYLTEQGVLVQWIQLYELNVELVASVIKALSKHFKDYAIYAATDFDILIVASNSELKPLSNQLFESAGLRKELNRIFIGTLTDINIRQVADKRFIEPLFYSYPIRANSDYYPVLDLGAAKARFLGSKAIDIVTSSFATLPVKRILSNRQPLLNGQPTRTEATILTLAYFSQIALNLKNKFLYNQDYSITIPMKYQTTLTNLVDTFIQCQPASQSGWIDTLMDFAEGTQPFLNNIDMQNIWAALQNTSCYASLSPMQKDWMALLDAIGQRQFQKMAGLSEWLLQHDVATEEKHRAFLLSAAMLGHHMIGRDDNARTNWQTYRKLVAADFTNKTNHRLLLANIGILPRFDSSQ
jgi:hypothetical protein